MRHRIAVFAQNTAALRFAIIFMLASAVLTFTPSSGRAEDNKISVFFEYSGDDSIGKQIAFLMLEEIRKSGSFRHTFDKSESVFTVSLVSMDPSGDAHHSIYSYSILLTNNDGFDYFITSYVGVCGSQRISTCAVDLFSNLGVQLEEIRRALMQYHSN